MVLFMKDSKVKAWRPWDDYVLLSFMMSSVLMLVELGQGSLSLELFFPTLLLMGHWQFCKESGGRIFAYSKLMPHFFLFQTLTLVGMAFATSRSGLLFMALIPCLAGGQFFSSHLDERKSWLGKGVSLLVLAGLSSLSLLTWGKFQLNYVDFVDIGCFIFWVFGMSYGVLDVYRKIEKPDKQNREIPGVNKERLFFHDLINHTHGLNLFLNMKIASSKGLTSDEVHSVYDEIRLMQSLIKDHYGYGHKNLVNTFDYVPFEFAKKGLYSLIRTFLPESKVRCEFRFEGFLSPENTEGQSCLIYYPSFHRILTNLVKNISETRSTRVCFVFAYDEEGFRCEVRNRFISLQNDRVALEKKLSSLIMEGDQVSRTDESGFGIESVNTLCEKEGGRFQFGLEGEEWVSRIFLPAPVGSAQDSYKKAA